MAVHEAPSLGHPKVNPQWKVAIIRSAWYPECTDALFQSARDALIRAGLRDKNIRSIVVPGSFELPLFCSRAIRKLKVHGVIAFGIVIQGETHHARLVAEQAAAGIMQVQLLTNVPIAFEVLYVHRMEDARKRSIGLHSKGPFAAAALLSCLAKLKEMR
ncbi:MAG: 6,7-dimethyl-8-ribityllumazine synthase [Candidatus Peribacteraceae bacterium]